MVGLCHYRRFFSRSLWDSLGKKPATAHSLQAALQQAGADFLVRRPIYFRQSMGRLLDSQERFHAGAMEQCFQQDFPEYLSAYQRYRRQRGMYQNNMFLCSRQELESYCSWLFAFLRRMEQLPGGIDPLDSSREAGYIAEHLLNIYLLCHNKRVVELDVTNLDTGLVKKLGARAKDFVLKHLPQGGTSKGEHFVYRN